MSDTHGPKAFLSIEPNERPPFYRLVAMGVAAGVCYSVADGILDQMSEKHGLVGVLYGVHEVIDLLMPILAGACFGAATHFVRVRSALAKSATASARELRLRLQRIERDHSAWVVAASTLHEVRNPLHALGLLLDELNTITEPDRDDLLRQAREEMDRIEEHLGRLRGVTGGGAPDIGSLSPSEIVEEVATGFRPGVTELGIELHTSIDPTLRARGDSTYVRIILDNLVRNAIEALRDHGAGGRVSVGAERRDGEVWIRVRDTGPGLDTSEESGMFRPLRTTKEGGLGLGLSVARGLARAMRGDLVLEPAAPDSGTSLRLQLPAES